MAKGAEPLEEENWLGRRGHEAVENSLNRNERNAAAPASNAIQRYFNIKRYSTGF